VLLQVIYYYYYILHHSLRGRPVKLSSNKHLKKFYELSSSEDEDGETGKGDLQEDVTESLTDARIESAEKKGELVDSESATSKQVRERDLSGEREICQVRERFVRRERDLSGERERDLSGERERFVR